MGFKIKDKVMMGLVAELILGIVLVIVAIFGFISIKKFYSTNLQKSNTLGGNREVITPKSLNGLAGDPNNTSNKTEDNSNIALTINKNEKTYENKPFSSSFFQSSNGESLNNKNDNSSKINMEEIHKVCTSYMRSQHITCSLQFININRVNFKYEVYIKYYLEYTEKTVKLTLVKNGDSYKVTGYDGNIESKYSLNNGGNNQSSNSNNQNNLDKDFTVDMACKYAKEYGGEGENGDTQYAGFDDPIYINGEKYFEVRLYSKDLLENGAVSGTLFNVLVNAKKEVYDAGEYHNSGKLEKL